MNQDETNSDGHQNPPARASHELELEARMVAWVAGEASAFEIAELERLIAEKPELAIFKRRMEAVQGLITEAMGAEKSPLRLSDERRATLLATIGGAAAASSPNTHVMEPAKPRGERWTWRVARVYYMVGGVAAACLLLLLQLPQYRKMQDREVSKVSAVSLPKAELLEREPASKATTDSSANESARVFELSPFTIPRADARDAVGPSRTLARGRSPENSQPVEQPPAPSEGQSAQADVANKPRTAAKVGGAAGSRFSTFGSDATLRAEADASGAGADLSAAFKPKAPSAGLLDKQSLTLGGAVAPSEGSYEFRSSVSGAVGSVTLGAEGKSAKIDALIADNALAKNHIAAHLPDQPGASFSDQAAPTQRSNGDSFGPVPPSNNPAKSAVFGERLSDSKRTPTTLLEDTTSTTLSASTISNDLSAASQVKGDGTVTLSAFEVSVDRGYNAAATVAPDNVGAAGKLVGAKEEQVKKLDSPAAAARVADAEVNTATEPVSTFSLHVSDVSFRLAVAATAAMERGEHSKSLQVRTEEFYNAFDYGDPAPSLQEKVGARIEQSAHPVLQQRNLLRIAVKVPAAGRGAGQPLRLTVLLDTSGSMEREDRRLSVRRALEELIALLGPNDRVTLIGFARQPRLLAEAVPGHQAGHLVELSARTPAEGGTNIEEALKLAGELALRHRLDTAQNRIVLLTDGAANLGDANPARLAAAVEKLRQQHIAFDACGIGLEGVGDNVLEALTRKGDGRYYVIERPEAADAAFARQLAGAFRPAAENVKLQVRFNPSRVGNYRLIGFEQHRLREEDFRNDKVDAAELAAEEAATALYQVEVLPQGSGELGEVYVRFRDAATGAMVERSWTIRHDAQAPRFDRATPSLQLAGISALVAEKLSESALSKQFKLGDFASVVNSLRGHYAQQTRVQELVMMYARLRRMNSE